MFTHKTTEPTLCLVKHKCGDIFIGHISFPTSKFTIEEYEVWENQSTPNMLCLTDKYPPEAINHYNMIEIAFLQSTAKLYSGIDFRKLLSIIFALNSKDFYVIKHAAEDYIKQFEEP
jgi:hypothetical protein